MGNYIPKSQIEKDFILIYEDITSLDAMIIIYTEIIDIIKNNPMIDKPNSFYTLLNKGYRTALIMGIRRHLKIYKESVSLIGTLIALKEKPEEVPSGKTVNIEQIDSDISELKQISGKIEYIADKFIAHIDKQSIGETKYIDQGELENILSLLEDKVKFYMNEYYPTYIFVGPEIKDWKNWKDIFKVPWINT